MCEVILTVDRIIGIVVALCFVLMFLFVPETFWDRTPRARKLRKPNSVFRSTIYRQQHEKRSTADAEADGPLDMRDIASGKHSNTTNPQGTIAERRRQNLAQQHVDFTDYDHTASDDKSGNMGKATDCDTAPGDFEKYPDPIPSALEKGKQTPKPWSHDVPKPLNPANHRLADRIMPLGEGPRTPDLRNFSSHYYTTYERENGDYVMNRHEAGSKEAPISDSTGAPDTQSSNEKPPAQSANPETLPYTNLLRSQPPKPYLQTLKPWNGKLRRENWFLVALRPFILFAYPSMLWSVLVYSLSIGWLIVLSEVISEIYKSRDTYNFTSLQTGLVYISPLVGGILGTAVAGKVSDIIVRFMSRRNGGVYEPEFRLVMAVPVAISSCIGLMGFGWIAEEKDNWIVPTVFFGIISFGCSLGSTTSITFAVDSYRQYAGEALVTLNFSKSKLLPHSHNAMATEIGQMYFMDSSFPFSSTAGSSLTDPRTLL